MRFFMAFGLILHFATSLAAQPANVPDDPWLLTRDIELVSRWPQGEAMREDKVAADLYRPRGEARVPAAVIVNSSGGISAQTELNYARVLARQGMAALVIDSFAPRGVRRSGDDQRRVSQDKSNADAIAGWKFLASQPWVDPARIIVMGMSRGGEAAYSVAIEGLRQRLRASDVRFAAHVAIAPGSCNFQQRNPKTNGAPIFFMLGELDEIQPVASCVEYIQRMRAAGPSNIRLGVYPGVHHAYEGTAGLGFAASDWNTSQCAGRFLRDEAGILYERASGKRATDGDQTDFLFHVCMKRGYAFGGDERVKAQAIADLLQFLRDAEVLRDEEARAIVPDCAKFADNAQRGNCIRARNGWTSDLVALARALRSGAGPANDSAVVRRLFELASARGNAHAHWELALLLRQEPGATRDLPRALALARASAEAGDPAGSTVYGTMIRDGVGRERNDAEAAIWFQRSADLRNSFGMTNLARLMWEGRGGLRQDRPAAVELWRRAIYQDENPWAQVLLAEALEKGEGVASDAAEALKLLRSAAGQNRDLDARRRASESVTRLEAAQHRAR